MIIKAIKDEDFVNYKKPSMFVGFPYCTLKCEKECGMKICQNKEMLKSKGIDISVDSLIKRYTNNNISKAIVCGGLEPLDSFQDLCDLISKFRKITDDDIIIYTGYNKEEIIDKMQVLKQYKNIFIKYGRYIPNQKQKYDKILGVTLASCNQYAEKIS